MQSTYDELLLLIDRELGAGAKPLEVTAVLLAVSLRMYRTILDPDDFDRMMDTISDGRDTILPMFGDAKTTRLQ